MAEQCSYTDSLGKIPENIGISYLPNHEQLSQKSLEKAVNIFSQGYIHDIKIFEKNESLTVNGKCFPSMKKTQNPHKINIDIDLLAEKIIDAHCTCKAGLSGHCSHVVGLIKTLQGLKLHNFTHIPDRQSCTSIPQQWNVPRGATIEPAPINHIIVAKPSEQPRKRKPILCHINTQEKLPKINAEDLVHLNSLEGTPLVDRIRSDIPTVSTVFGDVQIGSMLSYQSKNIKETSVGSTNQQKCGDLSVFQPSPVSLPDMYHNLNKNTHCADPITLELNTRQQSQCDLWFKERLNRLTASNFGKIMSRKIAPNENFLKQIFNPPNISARSLDYGKRHEKDAKDKYLQKYPTRHFHTCGFVVNNDYSFIGATPDAKICDNGDSGIVEIKCPFSARNHTIPEACDKIKKFYLQKDESGVISLNKTHSYYSQIQGQLLVTGHKFCEFVVFTQCDLFVERILPDVPFMANLLEKLALFYKDFALPYISKHSHDPSVCVDTPVSGPTGSSSTG